MLKKKSEDTQVSAIDKDTTSVAKIVDKAALKELERMEIQIKTGIIKYFETGMLLQQISDKKLYKLRGYHSFSEYCKETFDFSRSYGYRLLQCLELIER